MPPPKVEISPHNQKHTPHLGGVVIGAKKKPRPSGASLRKSGHMGVWRVENLLRPGGAVYYTTATEHEAPLLQGAVRVGDPALGSRLGMSSAGSNAKDRAGGQIVGWF